VSDPGTASAGAGITAAILCILAIFLGFIALMIASMWRIFTKAGRPGWAALIPLYNIYTLLKVVGRPGWWIPLYFIPLVDIVILIIVAFDLAKSFRKSGAFAFFGLFLFAPVGYLILAFGSAQYVGPGGRPAYAGGYPGGYPGAPGFPPQGGYPGYPGGYPQQNPYPGGQPGGYPGAPGGYPGGQQGGYPGAPGGYQSPYGQ